MSASKVLSADMTCLLDGDQAPPPLVYLPLASRTSPGWMDGRFHFLSRGPRGRDNSRGTSIEEASDTCSVPGPPSYSPSPECFHESVAEETVRGWLVSAGQGVSAAGAGGPGGTAGALLAGYLRRLRRYHSAQRPRADTCGPEGPRVRDQDSRLFKRMNVSFLSLLFGRPRRPSGRQVREPGQPARRERRGGSEWPASSRRTRAAAP